ncbi:MAG: nucleotidyltransferase family protein [Acidimicrobiales bacterium]|nr:nucleotidyltransferase family protein [Acidimicrobiales bacterium]
MTQPPGFAHARVIAAWGLPGVQLRAPGDPLEPGEWRVLERVVADQRLEGLLGAAVVDGGWPATDEQAEAALDLTHRAATLWLLLERELLAVTAELEQLGAPFRVLKGPAVAHLDYPDPSWRGFGDLDVLVPGRALEHLRDRWLAAGAVRAYPEPRSGFDRRFTKSVSLRRTTGWDVDLHRSLAPGPFGLALPVDELFDTAEHFELCDRTLPALDRVGRFLHACFHASLGQAGWRLPAVRDVAQLAPRDPLEQVETLRRAQRWDAVAVVAAAVSLAEEVLGWSAPTTFVARLRAAPISARTRRWLPLYRSTTRTSAALSLAGVEAVSGLRDKLAYAGSLVLRNDDGGVAPAARRARRALALARRPPRAT